MFYDSCKILFDNHTKICKENLIDSYKIKQIDIKIDHSYRTVDIISNLFNEFNCDENYNDLARSIMLLHDYGRFNQMLLTGTYKDSISFIDTGFNDHGEYGAYLLFRLQIITKTDLDKVFYDVMHDSIFYHAKYELPHFLKYRVNNFDLDIYSFVKKDPLCFTSLYAQAVRDADKLDIYNQVALGIIPSTYETLNFDVKHLDYVINTLKIPKEKILEINNIKSIENVSKIIIPVNIIDVDNLKINDELYKLFKEGNIPPLSILFKMPFYNFFYAGLVRLSFIRNMNFISSLKYICDNDLLNKMYNKYPDIYKCIVKEAFEYTDEYIHRKIKTRQIYI